MSVQELLNLPATAARAELAVALLDSLDESTDADWARAFVPAA